MNLKKALIESSKKFAFRHTSFGAPRYPYTVEPIQLATLVNEIERQKSVTGNIVEIGVARGMTTRFLAEHITKQGLDKSTTYYAIDTFNSFTDDDLQHEVINRGKNITALRSFEYNDYAVWKANFEQYPFVKAIQSDCVAFDYAAVSPIKIAFLDVDLYLPTKKTLPKLFDAMASGGVILVDDVLDGMPYDGAYQAYMEFCSERGMEPVFIGNKCGYIRKD